MYTDEGQLREMQHVLLVFRRVHTFSKPELKDVCFENPELYGYAVGIRRHSLPAARTYVVKLTSTTWHHGWRIHVA